MNDIHTTTWWDRFRTNTGEDDRYHVELYLRSLAPPHGTHDDYLEMRERLEQAVTSGAIASQQTTVLGDKICLCDRCQRTHIGRRYRDICVALREGGSDLVEPIGFEQRRIRSEFAGEEYTVLVPPTVCIGVFADSTLRGVFPSRVDGQHVDVTEFLEAVSRGGSEANRPRVDA